MRERLRTLLKRPGGERGVMIAEVLIATVVVVTGGAASIQLTAASMRALWLAGQETAATTLADEKLQQLRGLQWTVDVAGVPLSDGTTTLALQVPTDGGTGLAPSPAGSLERNIDGFVDFLNADLGWVGAGVTPPNGTAYVRRWSIAPLAADPDHTRILQVLVIPAGPAAGGVRAPGRRAPGEALLTSAVTRVGR